MNKTQIKRLATVLQEECCIEGARGPSGNWRAIGTDAGLQKAVEKVIEKALNEMGIEVTN